MIKGLLFILSVLLSLLIFVQPTKQESLGNAFSSMAQDQQHYRRHKTRMEKMFTLATYFTFVILCFMLVLFKMLY